MIDLKAHNPPLVSIVIPCYNHENFVEDSIQSVIDQSYENIELIIIDDGSKDHSVKKIKNMLDRCEQRFTRFEFRTRPNKGLSATLNEALTWCKGEFYSALASDDKMMPLKTEKQLEILSKQKDIVAVFGGVRVIDSDNNFIMFWTHADQKYKFEDILMHRHELPAATALMRLNAIKAIGGYNPNLKIEDWYMWLKLSKESNLLFLEEPVCEYRSHPTNFSKNIALMHIERVKVLNEFKNEPKINLAFLNAEWITASEYLRVNKVKALAMYSSILFRNPAYFLMQCMNRIKNRVV